MIESLTKEQEATFPYYVEKWKNIGLSTDNSAFGDTRPIEELIGNIYVNAGLKAPKNFHYHESPHDIKETLNKKFNSPTIYWCYGSNEVYWLSFYDFFMNETEAEVSDKLIPFFDISKLIYWWVPDENDVWISKKPNKIMMNDENKLHCDGGPAISFDDGFAIYALNGVKMPEKFVMADWNDIDSKDILKEQNAEIRRELVRKVGIERFISKINPDVLDTWKDYELLNVPINSAGEKRPYLKMLNPSIGTFHVEGVHPDCKTVADALKWRNGTTETPDVLT